MAEQEESGFVEGAEEAQDAPQAPAAELVGEKKPFVKKAELAKAFKASPKSQLSEAREREVQLTNLIGSQSRLIEQMERRLKELENYQSNRAAAEAKREQEMLDKTGVQKMGNGSLHAGAAAVTPPSNWNIPSLEPVLAPESDEGEATTFSSGWTDEVPMVIYNPHRQQVRIHDLKINPQDKEDVGLLLNPFTTVDLREYFDEAKIRSSRGLKHCLSKQIIVPASDDAGTGQPSVEPDSLQKRLSKAIGKVPRRGKVVRNPKTGKIEREQGIKDPELQRAAEQHVQQETTYDKQLAEEREYQESGSNIV